MKSRILSTKEKDACPGGHFLTRRKFFSVSAASLAGLAFHSHLTGQEKVDEHKPKPASTPPDIPTNIDEALKVPRTKASLPGRYPGQVVRISTGMASSEGKLNPPKIKTAVEKGLLELSGEKDIRSAWLQFVSPPDVVGIKVNPIGEKLLSTKPEVVEVIIDGLLQAGVPKKNIIIWDRRLFQLHEAGFTAERFPGIEILGTEMRGPNGEFYDDKGELWSKDNIDREAPFYFADVEGKYDKETLPYMVNEGKESYFTRILTRRSTKVINVPILKNAGPTVTLCLKNLSYGSLSNTSRLHRLWMKSVAEPCAFPALRDKVVLNIVDGLQACYEGGPGADPRYIWDANLMLFGTDPVAVDAVGHEFIVKERMKRGVQQLDDRKRRAFLDLAAGFGLGVAEPEKIKAKDITLT
jgi:uncharacterized protein (DUF362 family)